MKNKPNDLKKTIIRAERDNSCPYFTVPRQTAQNRKLSFEARGLLFYLLSKPDDWKVHVRDLEQGCKSGRVYRILDELAEHRYIKKPTRTQDKEGKIIWTSYLVYSIPYPEKPCMDEPYMEKQDIYIKESNKKENTEKDSPVSEKEPDTGGTDGSKDKEPKKQNITSLKQKDVERETVTLPDLLKETREKLNAHKPPRIIGPREAQATGALKLEDVPRDEKPRCHSIIGRKCEKCGASASTKFQYSAGMIILCDQCAALVGALPVKDIGDSSVPPAVPLVEQGDMDDRVGLYVLTKVRELEPKVGAGLTCVVCGAISKWQLTRREDFALADEFCDGHYQQLLELESGSVSNDTDSRTREKPKRKPRPDDELFDAISLNVFNIKPGVKVNGGRVAKCVKAMKQIAEQAAPEKTPALIALDVPKVLRFFKRKYPDCDLKSHVKLAEYYAEWLSVDTTNATEKPYDPTQDEAYMIPGEANGE